MEAEDLNSYVRGRGQGCMVVVRPGAVGGPLGSVSKQGASALDVLNMSRSVGWLEFDCWKPLHDVWGDVGFEECRALQHAVAGF